MRPAHPSTHAPLNDPRSAFPWAQPEFHGGERAALAHLAQYCKRGLPHSYKATRNGLYGCDYSTKWSPWLATGALSARQAWAAIQTFEAQQGATDSTYWIGFELLWRDHFRWLHLKYGARLYRLSGLSDAPRQTRTHNARGFERCTGRILLRRQGGQGRRVGRRVGTCGVNSTPRAGGRRAAR